MDETLALFKRLRSLDKSEDPSDRREWETIRARLCAMYSPLVVATARRMVQVLGLDEGNDLDDLISIGNEALIKAIDKFDPYLPVSFAHSVKVRIEGAMRHYKRDNASMIREPAYVQERRTKGEEPSVTAFGVGLAGQRENGVSNGLDVADVAPFEVSELAAARAVFAAFLQHSRAVANQQTGRTREALLREANVLDMHFRSKPAIEIARKLDISESSVATHLRNGLEKLARFSNCEN